MPVFALALAALAAVATPSPAVPGACVEPASANVGKPGCFLAAEIAIASPPPQLYWDVFEFPGRAEAEQAAALHPWSRVIEAHGRIWLLSVSAASVTTPRSAGLKAHSGPVTIAPGGPVTIRLLESWFPPGMKTRVHAHPGPEIFYVVDGEQCVETPDARARIKAGETFVVEGGPHLQAAPGGRRNLVMVVVPKGKPWIQLLDDWQPQGYCDTPANAVEKRRSSS